MNLKSTFSLVVLLLTTASLYAVARPDSFEAVSTQDNNDEGDAFSNPAPEFDDDSGSDVSASGLTKAEKKWEDGITGGDFGSLAGGPTGDDFGSWAGGPTGDGSTGDGNSMVCNEKGPCYMKKLTCPAKCFGKVSKSGSGFSASAGAGGCTMDCKTCTASC
ncbi:hypothetical protein HRI_002821600 [Hibiscus trionum]|uniref:Uncharacterized protein n=1 Tax=Hibiscus trionum TaxID=183268 RepID=A0A9W7IBT3_HIBTR|nr:hypothetical protein HRI_002821600 [Hibiscus trionum]